MILKQTTLAGSLLGLAWLAGLGEAETQEANPAQRGIMDVVGSDDAAAGEVVLSRQDGAILHVSFFASDAGSLFEGGMLRRAVTLASYVTVEETWQPELSHLLKVVDEQGAEPLVFWAGYQLGLEGNGGADYSVTVRPKPGLAWGAVRGVADLDVVPDPLSK